MRVRITEAAEADLEEIGHFIAQDSPVRADSFVQELLVQCRGLAKQSQRYPVFALVLGREMRRCPYGNYLIVYSILPDEIEVGRILHGARDYMRLLEL